MKIFGFNIGGSPVESVSSSNLRPEESGVSPEAVIYTNGGWGPAYAVSFNGEKNLGEMGPAKDYFLDYSLLRIRGWQAYLENEIAKTVLDKHANWIIGAGLRIQSTPVERLLKKYKVNIDAQELSQTIEAMFLLWAKSKRSSHSGESNLNSIAKECLKSAKIGGDTLVILRYENKNLNIQLIDGEALDSDPSCETLRSGNTIANGIEKDAKGRHVRYWIRKSDGSYYKLNAYNEVTGLRQIFLVQGSKYRIDSDRGLPILATVLETLKKLDRYKEAAVGSAEERQKIAYFIHHQLGSEGENPFLEAAAKAYSSENNGSESLPIDELGRQLANDVAATTNKQTFNMPVGSTMSQLESKNEMYFQEFYKTNADIICACLGIPPNVAFSLYTDSFSASRAATKDWEHTMEVEREDFQMQFYQPIYDYWLHMNILEGEISIDGYLGAFMDDNYTLLESIRSARFVGKNFPHIDPVKEAEAERIKLGTALAHVPLTTAERATEVLGGGDFYDNIRNIKEEKEDVEEIGIEAVRRYAYEDSGDKKPKKEK